MKRSIHLEVYYDSSIDDVWEALTDRDALGEWLMPNDFEPRVGHRFQFRTDPAPGWNGIVDCEVLEVTPNERLSYTWCNAANRLDTVVTWTLERHGEGTRVILDHTGFVGLRALLISEMLRRGWKGKLLKERLPEVLRQRRDHAKRRET